MGKGGRDLTFVGCPPCVRIFAYYLIATITFFRTGIIHIFHSFIRQYLLSPYSAPDTILDPWATSMNRLGDLALGELTF